jgi:hypothetical protein
MGLMLGMPEVKYVHSMLDNLERSLDDESSPGADAVMAVALSAELLELVPLADDKTERAAIGYAFRAAAAVIDRFGLVLLRPA